MILLQKKFSRLFALFVAGLLCTFLFSTVSSTAASNSNAVVTVANHNFVAPSFEQVAASHLEPNFYQ